MTTPRPRLDADTAAVPGQCPECQRERRLAPAAPPHSWEWPGKPLTGLHVDYPSLVMGSTFLVILDTHMKWLDGKLQAALDVLNKQVDEISNSQSNQQANIAELKKQADAMRKNIESEFTKLRQYLRDEEKVLMGKIKKKEDNILQQLEDNLKAVSTERAMLNERIMDIQQRMTMKDAEILKDIKQLLDGAETSKIKPTETKLNLNLYDPIGPLQYIVWKRMLKVINPGKADLERK
ncbi:nuclear factor 7, ovary-like [Chiloscyllium plagiosum]|uniref:nuclear factor 7, ovary-like n=1 Tax=Chiloscyllium plagiosum TaxID=36176 RepID=UPI001CB848CF|nr:nuclear factor 7, ovary-like [Chiloscyllium plagiosum]